MENQSGTTIDSNTMDKDDNLTSVLNHALQVVDTCAHYAVLVCARSDGPLARPGAATVAIDGTARPENITCARIRFSGDPTGGGAGQARGLPGACQLCTSIQQATQSKASAWY
jgi:hypothetical protein